MDGQRLEGLMDGAIYDFHTLKKDQSWGVFLEAAVELAIIAAWPDVFSYSKCIKRHADRAMPHTPGWRW